MARAPRLDAPNALHHVMARGIEKQEIFRDEIDARRFVDRLERSVAEDGWTIFAWSLLPNHFHLLVRTGDRPLGRTMASLLTGHAVVFNRRHERVGHLFQNRFRSILCEDESYFLELVRYIHLNPLRAGLVRDFDELDRFPFSGHAALVGAADRPWQTLEPILARFGFPRASAGGAYREFVRLGVAVGRRPELVTGRVLRRPDGWSSDIAVPLHGREKHSSNERALGRARFIAELERDLARDLRCARPSASVSVDDVLERVAHRAGARVEILWGHKANRRSSDLRAIAAYVWLEILGRSGSELARALRVGRATVYRGSRRIRLARRPEARSRRA